MKKIIQLSICLILAISLPSSLFSQTDEKLTIPLSNPNEPGFLMIKLLYGSITVNAHSNKEVVVETRSKSKSSTSKTKDGLKKIGSSGSGFSIEEYNNKVSIKAGASNKKMDFIIYVPKNFSLKLGAVNNGNIEVNGVHGDMEISNTNGAITLNEIGGSVIADALNRNIVVSFDLVDDNAPMAFTSLNGNLDVTFPSNVKADIKARTENGNVYTDFEMSQRMTSSVKENRNSNGVYKVNVDKWILGQINSGGPEMLFKTLNGNVYIRMK